MLFLYHMKIPKTLIHILCIKFFVGHFKIIVGALLIWRPMYLIAGIVITLTSVPPPIRTRLNMKPLHPTSIIGSLSCWTAIVFKYLKTAKTLCEKKLFINYLQINKTITTSCLIVMSIFLALTSSRFECAYRLLESKILWNPSRLRQNFIDPCFSPSPSLTFCFVVGIFLALFLPPLHWLHCTKIIQNLQSSSLESYLESRQDSHNTYFCHS